MLDELKEKEQEMATVTSSRTATVTLPTDEQILITREFDAPSTSSTRRGPRRSWSSAGGRSRGEMTVPRWTCASAALALRDGGLRGLRGRLPRRVPRDRPGRADRHTEVYEMPERRGRPRRAAEHHQLRRGDGRTTLTVLVECRARSSATRSSTPAWRPACRTRWTCSRRSRSRCASDCGTVS